MRVISGSAKGRKLASFKGSEIRPTSDRARESLFNVLQEKVAGSSFLDLFAGSGAIGIEAISRRAEHVVFVENQATSIELIKRNLERCSFLIDVKSALKEFPGVPSLLERSNGLNRNFEIIQKDVFTFLKGEKREFDIIFIDPPYKTDLAEESLLYLSRKDLLKPGGVIVLEHFSKKSVEQEINGLKCFKRKKTGDTMFSFYEKSDVN